MKSVQFEERMFSAIEGLHNVIGGITYSKLEIIQLLRGIFFLSI